MKRWLPFVLLAGTAGAAGAGPATAQEVTFNKDIAPILWKNCVGCHRPGDVGPFALLTYKEAAKRARHLKEVTASRRMPPWRPEPGWGEFLNARRLTEPEIALIARWADSGAKEGDPVDLPAPPQFAAEGWHLGEPDVVCKVSAPYPVPATGGDIYRCFVLPSNQTEDRWVSGFEVRAGNRRVVHHVSCFIDTSGEARKLDGRDGKPGYRTFGTVGVSRSAWLGGWVPGSTPYALPVGTGFMLKKGADLILQIHYHPDGKPETDQSSIALYFSKEPANRRVMLCGLAAVPIDIPAGAKRYLLKTSVTLPIDLQVLGISPHMHLIGRVMKVTATLPDGIVTPMISINDWDFNWQGYYMYQKPISLPKGTKLDLEARFDNSADNPQNPNNPPRRVLSGPKSTDEMCTCGLLVLPDEAAGYPVLSKWVTRMRIERTQKLKKARATLVAEKAPVEPAALSERVIELERRYEDLNRKLDLILRKLGSPTKGPPSKPIEANP